jgi:hypothetical protein
MFDRKRQFFQLDLDDLSLVTQSLTRGEIFQCYLDLGFPNREIPSENLSDQAKLETAIFRVACIEKPDEYTTDSLPAGVVTQSAQFILEQSGFLEGTEKQKEILTASLEYSRSSEAKGDALVMHTFSKYGIEELHAMDCAEWTRLVILAVTVQSEIYGVKAKEFLMSEPMNIESSQETNSHGLSEDFINRTFGLSSDKRGGFEKSAQVAGGGSITPNGVKTWGSAFG